MSVEKIQVVNRVEKTKEYDVTYKSQRVKTVKDEQTGEEERQYHYPELKKHPKMVKVQENKKHEKVEKVKLLIASDMLAENEWMTKEEAKEKFDRCEVNRAERAYISNQKAD
jgi:hypothetical protein